MNTTEPFSRRRRSEIALIVSTVRRVHLGAITLGALAALSACSAESDPAREAADERALSVTADTETSCVEPDAPTPEAADVLGLATTAIDVSEHVIPGELRLNLSYAPRGAPTNQAKVRYGFENDDPSGTRSFVDKQVAGRTVRVQTAPVSWRTSGSTDYLTTMGRPIRDVELTVTYQMQDVRGTRNIGALTYQVSTAANGAALDRFDPVGSLVPVPGSCEERGIVRFGPFPYGMPTVKFPEINGCSAERCEELAFAWVRFTHNSWRANQMFSLMDQMLPFERATAWFAPGVDPTGARASEKTALAYWFGGYDADRFAAVRETMHDQLTIATTAKTGSSKLRLICPNMEANPGNACSTDGVLAHHAVKGFINFCDFGFTHIQCNMGTHDMTLAELVHHETLHHVFTHLDGIKAIRDRVTHGHGALCGSDISSKPVYCEENGTAHDVRHFVTLGDECSHLDKVVQTTDANALFGLQIGESVRQGAMTFWPYVPPVPQPPTCHSDPNCLCDPIDAYTTPDGDDSPTTFCPDNGGEIVCMRTRWNGDATLGICTRCDEYRGPGCPCNDLWQPCEGGFCFGDDTFGNAAGTGTCYEDPPPAWGCLVDCERLIGAGAYCLYDHPGGARCIPGGVERPEASLCWESGGHIDTQTLSCTGDAECLNADDCHTLGYPSYFACDASLRCVPAL